MRRKSQLWSQTGLRLLRELPLQPRASCRREDLLGLLAMLDQQIGEGHVLVFASTFDDLENDFPVHASFVPFIEQTARYLGRLDAGPASVQVGSFAELRNSKEAAEFRALIAGELPAGWDKDLPRFTPKDSLATRESASRAEQAIAERVWALFGGAADLNESTFTDIKDGGDFERIRGRLAAALTAATVGSRPEVKSQFGRRNSYATEGGVRSERGQ